MKGNSYFLNFVLIILLYSITTSLAVLAFPEYISQREAALLQIFVFLLPVLYLARRATSATTTNNIFSSNIKLNINISVKSFRARTLVMMLWGLAGLALFFQGWEIIQNNIIPNSLKEFYNSVAEYAVHSQQQLVLNSSGTTFEFIKIVLCIALVPAICEEVLFRGYLLQSILEKNKKLKAIILSAILFSIIHFNPAATIPIFIIGVYLASLALATGSLLPPMLFHFFNNLLTIIVTNYYNSNYYYNSNINLEVTSIWFGCILAIIGSIIMYISYRKI